MALLRFPTVRDLYDAFPTAENDVGAPVSDEDSLTFLRALMTAGAWDRAVSFCAYILPRREAVLWGCQSLRRLQSQPRQAEIEALAAAETWVREPEEHTRREALDAGMRGDVRTAAVWLALAAGWSGGSMMPPGSAAMPAAPHQTARAVRAGLLIALTQIPADLAASAAQPCLEDGLRLAASRA